MASTVARFPAPNRAPNYPWNQWFDGRIWKLEKGVDYHSSHGLRTSAHRAARKKNVLITIVAKEKAIYLQAHTFFRPAWTRTRRLENGWC